MAVAPLMIRPNMKIAVRILMRRRRLGSSCIRAGRGLSSGRRVAGAYAGALNNIGENLVFLRRFSGDTEQIAQTDDKGGRVSRSVWSAWSLLPLSDVWRGSKGSKLHALHTLRAVWFRLCRPGDRRALPAITDYV